MPEVDDDVQVGRENPRYNHSCANPRCNGTIRSNGNPGCPDEGHKMNPHPDCTCDIVGFTGPCPIHGSPSMGTSSVAFHGLDPGESVSGNPSGSVISWRNLRLSSAIMSSKQASARWNNILQLEESLV